ncbi:MAG: Rieske 2Fe-2S domain-containing protein [Sphingomonadales bacterium]|nr:Rieske 2Fe-2S domain-containing protein [Sphingomonadales bacterium]
MSEQQAQPSGPDLTKGVSFTDLTHGKLIGHVGDEDVLVVCSGGGIFAVGAYCSHYHGPLADGLVEGTTVRCPWHHACFDLRTGEATHAPAFNPLSCWQVEQRAGRIFVSGRRAGAPARQAPAGAPERIVIVGGGAAGFAAAEMLHRQGFAGRITMLSADADAPVDRPNLSKDYLAGSAPEEWVPLQSDGFYAQRAPCRDGGRRDPSL